MPSKKKKYNARFPPARIKKIMQTDEDIGKVAAAVPVLISKCLEMFLTSILLHTGEVTKAKQAKTMSTSHLKECIVNVGMFDFLKDVVSDVPDMQTEEAPSTSGGVVGIGEEGKKLSRKRSMPVLKPPKKRFKLNQSLNSSSENNENTESDDCASEERSAHVAGSSHAPVQPIASYSISDRSETTDGKKSFHIPLGKLMSEDGDSALDTDRVLRIVTPERERQMSTTESIGDNLPSPSNGMSSPQKPIDLSIKVHGLHADSSKTTQAVSSKPTQGEAHAEQRHTRHGGESENDNISTLHSSAPNARSGVPSSLVMPHVYSPLAVHSSPGSYTSTKDTKTKIPPGGMLSFLYNSYPGNPTLPGTAPRSPPVACPPHLRTASHFDRTNPNETSLKNSGSTYPYNPVAEHQKRVKSSSPCPYLPVDAYHSHASTTQPNTLSQNTEDDDYDA